MSRDQDEALEPSVGQPKRLGDILVEEGILVRSEVDKLVQLQASQSIEERQPIGKLAVELGFLSERRLRDLLDLHGKRMTLGELLISRNLATEGQIETALEVQSENGGLLGEILVSEGIIDEITLTEVLAEQSDIPYVPLHQDESWKEGFTSLINEIYALKHGIAPVSHIGRVLTLAIWHPAAIALQQEIEQSTGLRVRFILDTRRAVFERIQNLYDLTDGEIDSAIEGQKDGPNVDTSGDGTTRYADMGLGEDESSNLVDIMDAGQGVFLVCGVTQDQVEEVYLRLLRFGKASGGGLDSSREIGSLTGLGEIKDARSAEAAFREVRNGELRLAIINAANTTMAFSRLLALGVHPERLASEFLGALAVCAVRRNCESCAGSYQPHKLVLAEWFGTRAAPAKARWRRGHGCDACQGTGFSAERTISEFWTPSSSEKDWMRTEGPTSSVRQFRESFLHRVSGVGYKALQMAISGETTLEEVLKVLPPHEVRTVRQAA